MEIHLILNTAKKTDPLNTVYAYRDQDNSDYSDYYVYDQVSEAAGTNFRVNYWSRRSRRMHILGHAPDVDDAERIIVAHRAHMQQLEALHDMLLEEYISYCSGLGCVPSATTLIDQ